MWGCWHDLHAKASPDHHALSSGDLDEVKQRVMDLARTIRCEVVLLTAEKDFYRTETLLLEHHLATTAPLSCDVCFVTCRRGATVCVEGLTFTDTRSTDARPSVYSASSP